MCVPYLRHAATYKPVVSVARRHAQEVLVLRCLPMAPMDMFDGSGRGCGIAVAEDFFIDIVVQVHAPGLLCVKARCLTGQRHPAKHHDFQGATISDVCVPCGDGYPTVALRDSQTLLLSVQVPPKTR